MLGRSPPRRTGATFARCDAVAMAWTGEFLKLPHTAPGRHDDEEPGSTRTQHDDTSAPAATCRSRRRRGASSCAACRSAEAANLTAHLSGLPGVKSGWTVRQIGHILFLRSIVETRRLKP